jgi:quercetin dioxygenase-like cupin family protein
MPVIVRNADQKTLQVAPGCDVVALVTPDVTGNDQILLERVSLAAGTSYEIALDPKMVGWVQALSGEGTLGDAEVSPSMVTYLPLGFSGSFVAGDGNAVLLMARVPDAERFDPEIADMPDELRQVDWTREPVLESEHDARKRIYMATPALAGTHAFKGEMISYPPGTAAPEHHHVGAEHFQYVISGRGTALLDGTGHVLEAGDLLYNYEHEPHAFINQSDEEFVFVEFFVPGSCETIWSPGANVCAWLPTGVDSAGRAPSREIGYHVHGQDDGL